RRAKRPLFRGTKRSMIFCLSRSVVIWKSQTRTRHNTTMQPTNGAPRFLLMRTLAPFAADREHRWADGTRNPGERMEVWTTKNGDVTARLRLAPEGLIESVDYIVKRLADVGITVPAGNRLVLARDL